MVVDYFAVYKDEVTKCFSCWAESVPGNYDIIEDARRDLDAGKPINWKALAQMLGVTEYELG